MILDSRIIEKEGKMIYQNYIAHDLDEDNGFLEFNFKNAKWVDVFSFKKGIITPCNIALDDKVGAERIAMNTTVPKHKRRKN